MAAFTIFRNMRTGACTAVYDSQLPTQTGIGRKEEWTPVYHGQASGLLDRTRQCKLVCRGLLARKYYAERRGLTARPALGLAGSL